MIVLPMLLLAGSCMAQRADVASATLSYDLEAIALPEKASEPSAAPVATSTVSPGVDIIDLLLQKAGKKKKR
jgi:hypothetical protein